ncbi:MAG: hypothetical protein JNK05_26500 [Myxococcales bacterium]|nr:hypothetical protein [Myxococcales bacterium]
MLELIVAIPLFMALCGVIPAAMWWSNRKDADALWPPRRTGTQVVNAGQYREGVAPTFSKQGPPREVLLAALGAWGLGQMFVPGLAVGLFGLLVVVGVVSIPGLILAWRLFFLGKPLLRGAPEAAPKARGLATFARVLNTIVVAVTLLLMAAKMADRSFAMHSVVETMMLGGPVLLYALMSFVHAGLLDRAADAIDEHNSVGGVATGVRVEPEEANSALNPIDAEAASVASAAPNQHGRS